MRVCVRRVDDGGGAFSLAGGRFLINSKGSKSAKSSSYSGSLSDASSASAAAVMCAAFSPDDTVDASESDPSESFEVLTLSVPSCRLGTGTDALLDRATLLLAELDCPCATAASPVFLSASFLNRFSTGEKTGEKMLRALADSVLGDATIASDVSRSFDRHRGPAPAAFANKQRGRGHRQEKAGTTQL